MQFHTINMSLRRVNVLDLISESYIVTSYVMKKGREPNGDLKPEQNQNQSSVMEGPTAEQTLIVSRWYRKHWERSRRSV